MDEPRKNKFIVRSDSEQFNSESFGDCSIIHEYLDSIHSSETVQNPAVAFVYSIVEYMSALRFWVEERFHQKTFTAKDKRKALPQDLAEQKNFQEDPDNPPVSIITRIAQQEFLFLERVLQGMKKVLMRNHRSIPIGKVQQLDAHSLIWLTRQPGITPAQKAGSKQRIFAVVRDESYNTLENRVLKALLKGCLPHAILYIRKYGCKFKETERLKAVQRQIGFCQAALRLPEMESIQRLQGMPSPNYVLLHDPLYSKIWQMYLDVYHQERLLENAWRNRHLLYREFFHFAVLRAIHKYNPVPFKNELWIRYLPENGCFIEHPSFFTIFQNGKCDYRETAESDFMQDSAVLHYRDKIFRFILFYIPSKISTNKQMCISEGSPNFYFIRSESSKCDFRYQRNVIKIETADDILEKAERVVTLLTGGKKS